MNIIDHRINARRCRKRRGRWNKHQHTCFGDTVSVAMEVGTGETDVEFDADRFVVPLEFACDVLVALALLVSSGGGEVSSQTALLRTSTLVLGMLPWKGTGVNLGI